MSGHLQTCAYCANVHATERDHVVARCFFAEQPRSHITVPACGECNRGQGDGVQRNLNMDEEYTRNVMCMTDGIELHPVAARLQTTVMRSVMRPGMFHRFAQGARLRTVRYSSGIVIPSVEMMSVEIARIARVIGKIAKGLFFHVFARSLSGEYEVAAVPFMDRVEFYERLVWLRMFKGRYGPVKIDPNSVFRYMAARIGPDPNDIAFLMTFYDRWPAVAVMRPRA